MTARLSPRRLAPIVALASALLLSVAPVAAQLVKPTAPTLPAPAQRTLQEQLEKQREAERAAEQERLRRRNDDRLSRLIEYKVECRLSTLRVAQRYVFFECVEVRENGRNAFNQRDDTGVVQRLSFYVERTASNEVTAQLVTTVATAAYLANRRVEVFSQPIRNGDIDAESWRLLGHGAALPLAAIQLIDR